MKIPQDVLEAKFSLNFAVAVAIVDGAAGLKQFTAERLHDPKRQKAYETESSSCACHVRRNKAEIGIETEIEILLKDGAVHRSRGSVARGHPSLARLARRDRR